MPSTLMDYDADRFRKTGKMSGKTRGKRAAKIRKKAIRQTQAEEMRKTGKAPVMARGKKATRERAKLLKEAARQEEAGAVKKGRDFLKKMGESGPEIRRHQQMKRNKGLILAENEENDTEETEPGATDDDATERIKRKKKMLEEAAG